MRRRSLRRAASLGACLGIACLAGIATPLRAHTADHRAAPPALDAAATKGLVSPAAVDHLMSLQAGRGRPVDAATRDEATRLLLARALFAKEARALGLDRSTSTRAELQIAADQILAQAYEQQLRRQFKPTEAEVRRKYDQSLGALARGMANTRVPPFDEVKAQIAELMFSDLLEQRRLALERRAGVGPKPARR